jgi:hypothetical protein
VSETKIDSTFKDSVWSWWLQSPVVQRRDHRGSQFLFNTYLVMWKYNCEPLWEGPYR